MMQCDMQRNEAGVFTCVNGCGFEWPRPIIRNCAAIDTSQSKPGDGRRRRLSYFMLRFRPGDALARLLVMIGVTGLYYRLRPPPEGGCPSCNDRRSWLNSAWVCAWRRVPI